MSEPSNDHERDEFERAGGQRPQSLLIEFWYFLRENKKWWLVPLLLSLAIYGLFLIVSISGGPAFMYTLF